MSSLRNIVALVVCIAICQIVGVVGGIISRKEIPTWYAALQKPPLNPPAWIFAPVWTVLYVLMGTAAFLVWRENSEQRNLALSIFTIQLALNALWSPMFFKLHSISGAMVIISLMLAAIVATIVLFAGISLAAAELMGTYLLWVCFATYLNAGLLVRNSSRGTV
jgi:tryptophan-rich sensory protein